MFNLDNLLDLNASEIEELARELKAIEDLALSEDGLGHIDTVISLFNDNLEGLYKEAMVSQVIARRKVFIEVVEELKDRRIRLEKYKEYLRSGSGVSVNQNQDYINIDIKDDYKNASELEFAIRSYLHKVYDDYDVMSKVSRREAELHDIISAKLRQEPPGDVSHERELLSIISSNRSLYNTLDGGLIGDLSNTREIPEKFDDVNKLFKTDLKNYKNVWSGETDYKLEGVGFFSNIGDFFGGIFGGEISEVEIPEGYKVVACGPDGKNIIGPDANAMRELLKDSAILEGVGMNVDDLTDMQIIWVFERYKNNDFSKIISGRSHIGTQLEEIQRMDNLGNTGYENHLPMGLERDENGYIENNKEYYIGDDGLLYFVDGKPPFPICFINYEAMSSFGVGAGDMIVINGEAYVVESAFSNYGMGTVDTEGNPVERYDSAGNLEEGPQIEIPSEDMKYGTDYGTDFDGNIDINAIQMSDGYLDELGINENDYHKIQESGSIDQSDKDDYDKVKGDYIVQ